MFPVHVSQVSYSIIPDPLDQGVGVWGAECKKFGCKLVDDNGDGLSVCSVLQVRCGGAPGMITQAKMILL
jgi:hypothetical protein